MSLPYSTAEGLLWWTQGHQIGAYLTLSVIAIATAVFVVCGGAAMSISAADNLDGGPYTLEERLKFRWATWGYRTLAVGGVIVSLVGVVLMFLWLFVAYAIGDVVDDRAATQEILLEAIAAADTEAELRPFLKASQGAVREMIPGHPAVTEALQLELLEGATPGVLSSMTKAPIIFPLAQEKLAVHPYDWVRERMASRTDTQSHLLVTLLHDTDGEVAATAYKNPSTPAIEKCLAVDRLLSETDSDIQQISPNGVC